MKVENRGGSFHIDEKRFYLPAVVSDNCPKCGKEDRHDLDSGYLSYPTANAPFDFNMYCEPCNHGWNVKLILRVSLEAP